MNDPRHRGWYVAGFVACVAAIVAVVLATGGDEKPKPVKPVKLPNGAPRPLQLAPPCRVSPTNGAPGICAPHGALTKPGFAPPRAPAGTKFVDLSNNNPVGLAGMKAIKARGYRGVIVKVNQARFIDPDATHMIRDARAAGLAVGGYDFADPTRVGAVEESRIFVGRLKQLGLCSGANVIPPTGDMEWGSITKNYVVTWLYSTQAGCASGGASARVQLYTGAWYWNPHVGCFWPAKAQGWISAYTSQSVFNYLPCGLPRALLREHQYTDREFNGANSGDASVFFGDFGAYVNPSPPLKPPSALARQKCKTLDRLRNHTPHPLLKPQRARRLANEAFMKRNHLSCTRGHVRRVAA